MKYLLTFFLSLNVAHAYTLNNNFGAAFKGKKVNVYVDAGTVCDQSSMTPYEMEELIGPAVDNFWNTVPTSALTLENGGFSAAITTMNHGRLCSPTDDACIAAGNAAGTSDPLEGLIPAVSDIVIGCNDNVDNFGGANVLAVTVPNKFSGKKIAGAVILINNISSTFGSLSRTDKISVIAHEIGHALGLGHSKDSDALMYYRTVDLRKSLGQDDIDGISYLYPMKLDMGGLLGGCGTISDGRTPPKDPPFWQMILSFGALILVFEVMKLLARSKTRTTA